VVRDAQGTPVPFATVTEAGTGRAVRADEKSAFSIPGGDNARLTVKATGF